MLRKIRIILAAVFFIGVTLLFLDFTGTLHAWLGWMAKIQFLPAVLAVNTLAVAALLLITILFGRVYCSVICPMGILQDIISWIHGRTNKTLPLHQSEELAQIPCTCPVHHRTCLRSQLAGPADCSIQRIRQNCGQPLRASVPVGQQPPGMGGHKS